MKPRRPHSCQSRSTPRCSFAERLVAVAKVDAAPDRRTRDCCSGPAPVGQLNRLTRLERANLKLSPSLKKGRRCQARGPAHPWAILEGWDGVSYLCGYFVHPLSM